MKKVVVVAALAASVLGLALPGANAQDAKLTVGLTSDFPSLDPSLDLSPIGFNFRLNVFDQLTEIRRDGSVGRATGKVLAGLARRQGVDFRIADRRKVSRPKSGNGR